MSACYDVTDQWIEKCCGDVAIDSIPLRGGCLANCTYKVGTAQVNLPKQQTSVLTPHASPLVANPVRARDPSLPIQTNTLHHVHLLSWAHPETFLSNTFLLPQNPRSLPAAATNSPSYLPHNKQTQWYVPSTPPPCQFRVQCAWWSGNAQLLMDNRRKHPNNDRRTCASRRRRRRRWGVLRRLGLRSKGRRSRRSVRRGSVRLPLDPRERRLGGDMWGGRM